MSDDRAGASASSPPTSPLPEHRSSPLQSKVEPVQRTQMVLDFGQKLRVTCKDCGMSYDRSSPEDTKMHTTHHARMMHGIPLPSKLISQASARDVGRSLAVRDAKKLKALSASGRTGSGSSLSSDLGLDDDDEVLVHRFDDVPAAEITTGSALERKLSEILAAMDDALGAAPLSDDVRKSSNVKLFVAVCRGKVVGAALISNVAKDAAREVLPSAKEGASDDDTDAVFAE